jgi:alpha-1,2-mannosyltransferase
VIDLVGGGSRRPVLLAAGGRGDGRVHRGDPGRRGWFDIGVDHDVVTYWVHAHGHLNDFVRPGTPYGFTYPPLAAVYMLLRRGASPLRRVVRRRTNS